MNVDGYKMVHNPFSFPPAVIDPHTVYEFNREEWDGPVTCRLSDFSRYTNLVGLYYREVTPPKA